MPVLVLQKEWEGETVLQVEIKPKRWILLPNYVNSGGRSVQNADIGGFHIDRHGYIGGFCYFVLILENSAYLCRIFDSEDVTVDPEILDHEEYGISLDDLMAAVLHDAGEYLVTGPHPISPLIEMKLRAIYD